LRLEGGGNVEGVLLAAGEPHQTLEQAAAE